MSVTFPLSKVTVPTYLRDAANGQLPASDLRTFDHRGPLFWPVSYAMEALHIAAWHDVVEHVFDPRIDLDSTGRIRTLARQEALFRERYKPGSENNKGKGYKYWNGNGKMERWYHQSGAMAATPGTSNHGLGLADDVAKDSNGDKIYESVTDVELRWLVAIAKKAGFGWEVKSEPWHIHWIGGNELSQWVVDILHAAGVKIDRKKLAEFGFTAPQPTGVKPDPTPNPPKPPEPPKPDPKPPTPPKPPKPDDCLLPSTLSPGQRSVAIGELQAFLKRDGLYNFRIDNLYGAQTRNGVAEKQKQLRTKGLYTDKIDGIFGRNTRAAWCADLAGKGKDPLPPPPPVLKHGDTDTSTKQGGAPHGRVTWLQQYMKDRGWHSGAVDGRFGDETQKSVRRMQTAIGVAVDGVYGSITAGRLPA